MSELPEPGPTEHARGNCRERRLGKGTRLVFGLASTVIGGVIAYGSFLLFTAWMESSNPVARGHGVDFFAFFALWLFEMLLAYCWVPIGIALGAVVGAIYVPQWV
jgi:hypothetical protein